MLDCRWQWNDAYSNQGFLRNTPVWRHNDAFHVNHKCYKKDSIRSYICSRNNPDSNTLFEDQDNEIKSDLITSILKTLPSMLSMEKFFSLLVQGFCLNVFLHENTPMECKRIDQVCELLYETSAKNSFVMHEQIFGISKRTVSWEICFLVAAKERRLLTWLKVLLWKRCNFDESKAAFRDLIAIIYG